MSGALFVPVMLLCFFAPHWWFLWFGLWFLASLAWGDR